MISMVQHRKPGRDGLPWRAGPEFNNPLIARAVSPNKGELPGRWGILSVSQDGVVTSALEPGNDGTAVLRVYEAAGKPAQPVRVTFHAAISQARDANLIEDASTELQMDHDSIVFDLRPFENQDIQVHTEAAGRSRESLKGAH